MMVIYYYTYSHIIAEVDLELDCYTIAHGDRINGRTVQVYFTANQPAVFIVVE